MFVNFDLEVIKLEYSRKFKIKRNDWLLAYRCPQAVKHCALFEFENELKYYNLEARSLDCMRVQLKDNNSKIYYKIKDVDTQKNTYSLNEMVLLKHPNMDITYLQFYAKMPVMLLKKMLALVCFTLM